jgi:hypothetical protein
VTWQMTRTKTRPPAPPSCCWSASKPGSSAERRTACCAFTCAVEKLDLALGGKADANRHQAWQDQACAARRDTLTASTSAGASNSSSRLPISAIGVSPELATRGAGRQGSTNPLLTGQRSGRWGVMVSRGRLVQPRASAGRTRQGDRRGQ